MLFSRDLPSIIRYLSINLFEMKAKNFLHQRNKTKVSQSGRSNLLTSPSEQIFYHFKFKTKSVSKLSRCEKKAWKISALNGIWTHDL